MDLGGGGDGYGGNWEGQTVMGNGEGETRMGKWGGIEVLARAGSGEGEMGRGNLEGKGGQWEGRDGEGGQQEGLEGGDSKGANGRGRRRGKKRGDFIDGYDEMPRWTYGMPGWNEVTKFSHFVYPCNAGYLS